MQNKSLSIVIILIILLAGGYFILSDPKDVKAPPLEKITATENTTPSAPEEAPSAASTPKQKHEVTYTADGFAPAVLSIAVGDTVTFTNKSGSAFLPASNPHPMHTDYSDFDSKTEIPDEKTYEFIFTKPGEWGYHNHLNPKMMGVVVVK